MQRFMYQTETYHSALCHCGFHMSGVESVGVVNFGSVVIHYTDNCIALFHLHHLSAVFVVIARCCLKFLFSSFFVFLLSPLWLHIPLCLTMTSRLHALPSTLSMFAIHVTIYLMMLLSLSMHVDVIICKLCKQICYVLQLQQY